MQPKLRFTTMYQMRLLAVTSLLVLILSVLPGPLPAQAQLTFIVLPDSVQGSPDTNVFFSGTLANQQNSELFLDSISINFGNEVMPYFNALPFEEDPFFNGTVPISLVDTSDVYEGVIFGFHVSESAPVGFYNGTATITSYYSGEDIFTTTQDFRIEVAQTPVAPVPLPNSVTALVIGGVSLWLTSFRRSRTTIKRRASISKPDED